MRIEVAEAAKIITLLVRPPDLWWDNSRQRSNVKYTVHGQKLCEESFVHVHWGSSFRQISLLQKKEKRLDLVHCNTRSTDYRSPRPEQVDVAKDASSRAQKTAE